MRTLTGKVLLPAIAVLLASALAAAQPGRRGPEYRRWEFSVFGGGSFLGDRSYPTAVTGSSTQTSRTVGLQFATGSLFGARVTENRGDRLGAVAEYSYSNLPVTFTGLSDSLPSHSPGHAVHRMEYDILYYGTDRAHRLRPYVLGGVGMMLYHIAHTSVPDQNLTLSDSWKFAVNWGGGVKYLIWDQFGVTAQYAGSITTTPSYGLSSAANLNGTQFTPGMNDSGYYYISLLSVGLFYTWGPR